MAKGIRGRLLWRLCAQRVLGRIGIGGPWECLGGCWECPAGRGYCGSWLLWGRLTACPLSAWGAHTIVG